MNREHQVTHCRHGIPYWSCAKMCPDPTLPVPRKRPYGWLPLVLAVLAIVVWIVLAVIVVGPRG